MDPDDMTDLERVEIERPPMLNWNQHLLHVFAIIISAAVLSSFLLLHFVDENHPVAALLVTVAIIVLINEAKRSGINLERLECLRQLRNAREARKNESA